MEGTTLRWHLFVSTPSVIIMTIITTIIATAALTRAFLLADRVVVVAAVRAAVAILVAIIIVIDLIIAGKSRNRKNQKALHTVGYVYYIYMYVFSLLILFICDVKWKSAYLLLLYGIYSILRIEPGSLLTACRCYR